MLWHDDPLKLMRRRVTELEPDSTAALPEFDCYVVRGDGDGYRYSILDSDRYPLKTFYEIETLQRLELVFTYLETRYHTAPEHRQRGEPVKRYVRHKPRRRVPRYPPEIRQQVIEMTAAGMSKQAVADYFQMNKKTVYKIIEGAQG